MAQLHFGSQFARLVETGSAQSSATTLRAAFDEVFAARPLLRGYVLDEQGHLRQHVAVFVDGALVSDREQLAVTLRSDSEIYILPALSGG
jgi:molybdopterin converting factor small subunit